MKENMFNDLFVLELANNHWGSVERGLQIIDAFAKVIKENGVKAAIKLQFRDLATFIHRDFRCLKDYRYIAKTMATQLGEAEDRILVDSIRNHGIIVMSTPFDEVSVDVCERLGIQILKIASSDINDWVLIKKIAQTRKPVIVSTGGASLDDMQKCVNYFNERDIPLAINHCIAQYPTERGDMELSQIDYLRELFPNNVIGFSTHEHNEGIEETIMMAYAKGARTFERHIDIPNNEKGVSAYCSLPGDIDRWIKGYKRAVLLEGSCGRTRRAIPSRETSYLDALVRGVYAKRDLPAGHVLREDDVYFAIPVQKGQLSCREFNGTEVLMQSCEADKPLMINSVTADYLSDAARAKINGRGL